MRARARPHARFPFVARGFIPAGLRSSPSTSSQYDLPDPPGRWHSGPLRAPAGINPLATMNVTLNMDKGSPGDVVSKAKENPR